MNKLETKDVKLSSVAQILILDQGLGKIISIFLDTFLAAYFYKISQQNILYLSLYNVIGWFVAMYLFGKYYDKSRKKGILSLTASVILISFAGILLRINLVTIVLYNLVYYVFMNILLNITEVSLFDYSNREPFVEKFNTEYFIFREIFLNFGRIFRLCNVANFCGIDAKS